MSDSKVHRSHKQEKKEECHILCAQHVFYERVHNTNLLAGHSVSVKIYCFRLKFLTVTAFRLRHVRELDFQSEVSSLA